jgi:hypothetical protein
MKGHTHNVPIQVKCGREREECLCVAGRPNYIDGGSEKKRMAACLFFYGMGERPRDTRCVCSEREGGVDQDSEMGVHMYVIGRELSSW